MPPLIIALSGKQYAGKDHVADWLLAHLSGYRKSPIAHALKTEYARRHGLTLATLEADKAQHRPGLIVLGNWGRAQRPDYWLAQALAVPGPKIIPDVRLQHEHALLRQHGAFLIRVEADRAIRAQRGTLVSEDDTTECDLDAMADWDAVIDNNGSSHVLETRLQQLLAELAAFGGPPPEGRLC